MRTRFNLTQYLIVSISCVATTVVSQQPRRPVDACLIDNDTRLLVICERSGEVIEVDADDGRVISALKLGGTLNWVEALSGDQAVVTDRSGDRLVFIDINDEGVAIGKSIHGFRDPVAVEPGDDKALFVAGHWSREVSCVDLSNVQKDADRVWRTDLNFSPGEIRYLDKERVVLAIDAYGSQIAFLDADTGKHVRQVEFYGHRIRGMIDDPDGKRLIVSHQMLNATAQATTNDITWGMMVSNDLRWLDRSRIMTADGDAFYKGGHIDPIGIVGQGGADPNDVVISPSGVVVVPLGGTDQVAIGTEDDYEISRVRVGINPIAVAMDSKGEIVWVVNRLDDSLTKIDVTKKQVVKNVKLSGDWQPTVAELGERLFHKSTFSHQHWMTCASCHPGGHAINERADNLSDGAFTSPKRVMSLLGRANTAPFGWIGKDMTLEGQVKRSVSTTMRGSRALTKDEVIRLTAFVKTLEPPPSVIHHPEPSVVDSIARGKAIFARQSCSDCHKTPHYTSDELFDVGLEDEVGNTHFNPPPLIGIGQRGPRYLHDLRAQSLEEVFSKFKHSLKGDLSEAELADLLTFLKSL